MIFSGAAIAAATGGQLIADGPAGPVQTDSRRLTPGAWVLALSGDRSLCTTGEFVMVAVDARRRPAPIAR